MAGKPQIYLFAYPNIAGPAEFFANRKETEAEMDCYFRRLCTVVAFIACRLPSMLTYLHFIPFYAAATSPCQKLFHFACNIYFVHAISMFMFIYQRIIIQKEMKRSKNHHPFLFKSSINSNPNSPRYSKLALGSRATRAFSVSVVWHKTTKLFVVTWSAF